MAKRHDENRDLKSISKIGRIDIVNKTIQVNKNTLIGIHMWGKIDFLTHYCGWYFTWDNSVGVRNNNYTTNIEEDKQQKQKIKKSFNNYG